ncbi:MAG: metal ABC transporter permease, partial [Aquiluna sp.]
LRLTSSQLWVPVLSVTFALVSMVGGTLLALGGTLPISPYVTTISFLIYLAARLVAKVRNGA